MKVLGIIPARRGSKRLPYKNLRLLAGKPLVAWAIESARHVTHIERLIVSSDNDAVLELAASYDPALPHRRPAELATDVSPAVDYVRYGLSELEEAGEGPFDAVVIIQPSSPLTLSEDIDATIELLERSGADTAVSVVKVPHDVHPLKFKVMQEDRLLPYFEAEKDRMAAHELPEVYVRNCAVYATHRHVVDEGQIIGADCRGYVMPRERSVDINDLMDLRFAESLMASREHAAVDGDAVRGPNVTPG